MKRKSLITTMIIVVFLTILFTFLFFSIEKNNQTISLTFAHNFAEYESSALNSLTTRFEIENPGTTIEYLPMTFLEMRSGIYKGELKPDIFLWQGPVVKEFPFKTSSPQFWMGTGWSLAVNRSIIPVDLYEKITSSRTVEALEESMDLLIDQKIIPISVGNSHLWPLGIWSQHIQVSLGDAEATYIPRMDSDNQSYYDSWDMLRRWYGKDFFHKSSWNEGWSKGVASMSRGEAAFSLVSDKMLTAIQEDMREHIEFLKFPQGDRNPWLIGAGTSIIINEDGPVSDRAKVLLDFLTDPDNTKVLTYQLNRFFYSSENLTMAEHIPSWQELANSQEMREYNLRLKYYTEEE